MPLVPALCPAARPTASAPLYTHSTDHNFRLILGSYRLTSLDVHTNCLPTTQSTPFPGHKYNHDTKTYWGEMQSSSTHSNPAPGGTPTHSAVVPMPTITMYPGC